MRDTGLADEEGKSLCELKGSPAEEWGVEAPCCSNSGRKGYPFDVGWEIGSVSAGKWEWERPSNGCSGS